MRHYTTPEEREKHIRAIAATKLSVRQYAKKEKNIGGGQWISLALVKAYPDSKPYSTLQAIQNGWLPVDEVIAKVEASRIKKNDKKGVGKIAAKEFLLRLELLEREVARLHELVALQMRK